MSVTDVCSSQTLHPRGSAHRVLRALVVRHACGCALLAACAATPFAVTDALHPCPRSGHCKKLTPIYDKVGAHFAGREDVVIAKMDATANDVVDPRFSVKGFPTIYLVQPGGEAVQYSGDRSESDLIKFVSEHTGDVAVPPAGSPEPPKDEL